jgi:hypothetical protein
MKNKKLWLQYPREIKNSKTISIYLKSDVGSTEKC